MRLLQPGLYLVVARPSSGPVHQTQGKAKPHYSLRVSLSSSSCKSNTALKNPKPADGLHDVEKIRLMRGGITRRQPRVSLRGKGDDTGSDRGTPMSGTPNGQFDRRLTLGSQDMAGGGASGLTGRGAGGGGGGGGDGSMHSPVATRDSGWVLNRTSWQVRLVASFLAIPVAFSFSPSCRVSLLTRSRALVSSTTFHLDTAKASLPAMQPHPSDPHKDLASTRMAARARNRTYGQKSPKKESLAKQQSWRSARSWKASRLRGNTTTTQTTKAD